MVICMLREQLGHSPYIMWHWHRRTSIQQYAQYLEVVLVRRQHQWRNVRRKHGRIYVHCLPALWKNQISMRLGPLDCPWPLSLEDTPCGVQHFIAYALQL